MTRLYRYRAFGLSIASALALPAPLEPNPDGTSIDLTIRVGLLQEPPTPGAAIKRISSALEIDHGDPDRWLLFAYGLDPTQRFTASVRAGDIEVGWNAGVEISDLAQHLLGLALAAHTFICGRVCLHGSAVRSHGRCIVILGDSGRGKSTLTAALVAAGAQLVAEEFIILGNDPNRICTGIPFVKISPNAAAALGLSGIARRAYEHADFVGEGVRVDFSETSFASFDQVPIDDIYLLGARHDAPDPRFSQRLATAEAANALTRAAYWMPHLPKATQLHVMRATFEVALQRRVYRLALPNDLSALPRTAALINNQIAGMEVG